MIEVFDGASGKTEKLQHRTYESAPADIGLAAERFYWIDMNVIGEPEKQMLRDQFKLHPLAIEDCIEHSHIPKLDDYRDYIYIVLHATDESAPAGTIRTVEIDVFLGPNYLITYHDARVPEIDVIKKEAKDKPLLLTRGADFMLQVLLERIVTNYFPRLDGFEERINQLEEKVLQDGGSGRMIEQLLDLKREIVQLKRVIHPQRELFLKLSRPEFPELVDEQTLLYFRDVYDQIYRISELVDGYREMLTNLFDAHYAIITYRMNDIIRVLTVFTTVLMPMTFITGIFGMNFERMPLLRDHTGFWLAVSMMAVVAVLMVLFFRRKRWL